MNEKFTKEQNDKQAREITGNSPAAARLGARARAFAHALPGACLSLLLMILFAGNAWGQHTEKVVKEYSFTGTVNDNHDTRKTTHYFTVPAGVTSAGINMPVDLTNAVQALGFNSAKELFDSGKFKVPTIPSSDAASAICWTETAN